jgi:hypothetical protein
MGRKKPFFLASTTPLRQRGRMKDDKMDRPEYFILPREANKVSPGVYMRVNEEASRCSRQRGRMKDEGYIYKFKCIPNSLHNCRVP